MSTRTSWTYPRCFVVGVYDGDTVTVNMDLGQDMWVMRRSVRLVGMAARELREPGGPEAQAYLSALLPVGIAVVVESTGWDKYAGRIDGRVSVVMSTRDVGALMIDAGYAVPWNGKGPQPKPEWPKAEA